MVQQQDDVTKQQRLAAQEQLGMQDPDGRLMYGATTAAKLLGISLQSFKKLVQPCDHTQNPHYKSGPPVGLYDPIELLRVSKEQKFLEAKARCTPERKASAQRAVETKRKQLEAWLANLKIEFKLSPKTTLVSLAKLAIENRNGASCCYPDGDPRPNFEEAEFRSGCETEPHVRRWMVNYLRHRATDYERILEDKAGRVGFRDMYEKLRAMINEQAEKTIDVLLARQRDQQGER